MGRFGRSIFLSLGVVGGFSIALAIGRSFVSLGVVVGFLNFPHHHSFVSDP